MYKLATLGVSVYFCIDLLFAQRLSSLWTFTEGLLLILLVCIHNYQSEIRTHVRSKKSLFVICLKPQLTIPLPNLNSTHTCVVLTKIFLYITFYQLNLSVAPLT